MFVTIVEIVGTAIVAYNLWSLFRVLYRKCICSQKPVIRGLRQHPTDPYSAYVKHRDPTNADHLGPTQDHPFAKHCSTIPELFARVVDKYSDKQCFGLRQVFDVKEEPLPNGRTLRKWTLGDYQWQTYRQVFRSVRATHLGLTRVGIRAGDIVMLYADTRLEWMVSCQALFRLGATVGTLYTNLGEEGIVHAINETEATHLITNVELLNKIIKLMDKLPNISVIVCITDSHQRQSDLNHKLSDSDRQRVTIYSLDQIQLMGEPALDSPEDIPAQQSKDSTAVLMYTSGSTGVPKGVLIAHKNLLLTIKAFYQICGILSPETDVYAAFLPLAHILEICLELCFISIGIPVGYASVHTMTDKSPGLQKGCRGDLILLQPTFLAVVPLLLERIRNGIIEELSKNRSKQMVGKVIGGLLNYKSFWAKQGIDTPIINATICRKFNKLLGGRVKIIASGGAYLSPQTQEFIRNLFGVYVVQGYGLTETTASASISDFDDLDIGHVGAPSNDVFVKLIDWPEGGYGPRDTPNPRGEIVIGGECVTNGYFKRPELNEEYYETDDKGIKWFYSGDIGEVLPSGVIKIIDRKKDIIKLANGQYISLSKIEEELKQNPLVDNICVYGNQNTNTLIALIVPNLKELQKLVNNTDGEDDRQALERLFADPTLTAKVYERVCSAARLTRAETPAKIKLCSEEWLPDNGLVTASFKLKRKAIEHYYRNHIHRMLASNDNNPKQKVH